MESDKIFNEDEVCKCLNLPGIPKRVWDGKSSFKHGVAVVTCQTGIKTYVIVTYDAEKDTSPRVKRVFSPDIFIIDATTPIFVVPEYMDEDVSSMDLDDASKARAEELINEAHTTVATPQDDGGEGEEEGGGQASHDDDNEYSFDFIHNDEEAKAYIAAYNKAHHTGGRIPTTHEGITTRLAVIYATESNKN